MIAFVRFSHSTNKHRYNVYSCGFCSREFIRRQSVDYNAISCGCRPPGLRHGHERGYKPSPELKCYRKMLERCNNRNCKDYGNYGGRGIKVCDAWAESFEVFLSDMGPRPSTKHSIERLDVDADYSTKNCVWATKYEQARNTRANVHVKLGSETKIITDWLRHFKISRTVFYRYMKKNGVGHVVALKHLAGI